MLQKAFIHARQGTLMPTVKNKFNQIMGLSHVKENIRYKIEEALKLPEKDSIQSTEAIIQRHFKRALNKKYGLPHDYISKLSTLVVTRRKCYRFLYDSYNELMEHTKELSPELMPSEDWKNLSYLMISTGLFQLGGVARDKAIESAYISAEKKKKPLIAVEDAFKASIDKGDLKTAGEMLERINNAYVSKNKLIKFNSIYQFLSGNKEEALKTIQEAFCEEDWRYLNYIKGKTVAIVGPAPSDDSLAEEIDKHDVVVRLNYKDKKTLPDPKQFGNRINVSYYNNSNVERYFIGENENFLNDLDCYIFRTQKQLDFFKPLAKGRIIRKMYCPNDLLFIGNTNMIQNTLFDLLFFNADLIKVFKVNFFHAKKAYHEGYISSEREEIGDITWRWERFAHHNLISQLNFTRLLVGNGLINTDSVCESILRLNNQDYLATMEDIYVDVPLKSISTLTK